VKDLAGVKRTDVDLAALRPVDLAPVDEFHMGGRAATADVINLMREQNALVLDIGSGLGGVARTWHPSTNAARRVSISFPSTSNSKDN
jgi:hypothetical protein